MKCSSTSDALVNDGAQNVVEKTSKILKRKSSRKQRKKWSSVHSDEESDSSDSLWIPDMEPKAKTNKNDKRLKLNDENEDGYSSTTDTELATTSRRSRRSKVQKPKCSTDKEPAMTSDPLNENDLNLVASGEPSVNRRQSTRIRKPKKY